ncbi:hypothetical protein [Nonomuraea sp. SYSU D8015]|uniref:hypothetical protein n=1 Tax=Nonomuraea sp. SYSU D8015 TaxID=2593644 RepID=UPI001CB6D050|nr:hypothetical protein [Nonomuraea sp. SYSU D8015]
MIAQGHLDAIRATVAPRMTKIVRAADVPRAGHWLFEENPRFVTAELERGLTWQAGDAQRRTACQAG